MTPDGEDIIRLGLPEWADFEYGSYGWHFDLQGKISPNGEQIAVIATKWDHGYSYYYTPTISSSQLWVMDSEGNNTRLLDSFYQGKISGLAWSPDSQQVSVMCKHIVHCFGVSTSVVIQIHIIVMTSFMLNIRFIVSTSFMLYIISRVLDITLEVMTMKDLYEERIIAIRRYIEGETPSQIYTRLKRSPKWVFSNGNAGMNCTG